MSRMTGFYSKPNKTMKTQTFTASGTWTKPDGVEYVLVTMCGGGAGGQGALSNNAGYGIGGGAGEAYEDYFLQVSLPTYAITVGSGGGGGVGSTLTPSVSAGPGEAGGVTSFGNLLSASGGSIQSGQSSGRQYSEDNTTKHFVGGKGQSCPNFGDGGFGGNIGNIYGKTGTGFGSGGGGGGAVVNTGIGGGGGAGRPGIVIVKWFE